jgi:hypothetical protein
MGCGKQYLAGEADILSQAWVKASTNSTLGNGMRGSVFWNFIKINYDELCPEEYEQGTYKDRSASNLKNYWNDHLHPQVNKFQQVLTKVLATQFTGNLTADQKINIAVAYYTGATKKIHYDFRDFDSKNHWKLFSAWYNTLRHQPKWARELDGTNNAPVPPIHQAIAQLGQRVAAAGNLLDESLVPIAPRGSIPPPMTAITAGSVTAADPAAAAPAPGVAAAPGSDPTTQDSSLSSGEDSGVAASAKKFGGFLGRNKAKESLKKSKIDELKAKSLEQTQEYMTHMVTIAKSQAKTTDELKEVLQKNLQLEERSKLIQEAKLKLKFAQTLKDEEMFAEAKEELKELLYKKQEVQQPTLETANLHRNNDPYEGDVDGDSESEEVSQKAAV